MTEEQLKHLVASTVDLRANGIGTAMLDPIEARSLVPTLSERVHGVQFRHGRGHLWPFALVHAFAAAKRRGAELRVGQPQQRIVRKDDRVTVVIVGGELIETDDVVLATKVYTPALLPELPAGAIVPARGQILVTQPVPPLVPFSFGPNFDQEFAQQPHVRRTGGPYPRPEPYFAHTM